MILEDGRGRHRIEEYERRGVDRQQYGEKLLDRLSESLIQKGVSRCDRRELAPKTHLEPIMAIRWALR